MHEAQLHKENCFVTLTYADAPVSLVKRDVQLFLKRLRRFFHGERISYFQCGEYGDQFARPHHHALLFGVDFPDKRARYQGSELYTSKTLDRLWGLGQCMIGAVTFESAAYVARYCVKKITGDQAAEHYQDRLPEFVTMSTRPAIGQRWYELFGEEVRRHDSVVARGREMRPPRFYDKCQERLDAAAAKRVKLERARLAKSAQVRENTTPERLAVREKVASSKLAQLRRTL